MRRSLIIVGLMMSLSAFAVAGGGERTPPQDRNTVWRTIFVRPPEAPPPPAGTPESERIALGRDLFRDTRLSGDGTRACATCHDPARAFTDGRPKAMGRDGGSLRRNVPSLYGVAWGKAFFWDGRAASLETQMLSPMLAKDEMAGDLDRTVARLEADPEMAERFARAFPAAPAVSADGIVAAIAAYERTLVPPGSRFDRWVGGDDGALDPREAQGFDLFVGKAGCVACHGGWRLTDDGFHDIGLPGGDPGRSAVPGGTPGLPQFKTPSLRELTLTAPYMHDGSLPTLRAVVDHYAGGLVERPSLAPGIVRDLALSEEEKDALVAFLRTLSSRMGD